MLLAPRERERKKKIERFYDCERKKIRKNTARERGRERERESLNV